MEENDYVRYDIAQKCNTYKMLRQGRVVGQKCCKLLSNQCCN